MGGSEHWLLEDETVEIIVKGFDERELVPGLRPRKAQSHRRTEDLPPEIQPGENMLLADILTEVAGICGRKPPTVKLPHGALVPVALVLHLFDHLGVPGGTCR